tara:strand:+ start:7205 stop:9688 length:2484 start_codon:yes stop_codon:yes gene_type:complete
MATLTGQTIASSYEQLLSLPDGGGNSTTLVSITDGDAGTTFGFQISTNALMMTSTNQLQFGDTGTYIHQSADGVLDLVSDSEIEINATTIDINGAVDISGNTTIGGDLTVNGTSTYINSTTLQIDDKLIELAHSPSGSEGADTAIDGGGIILKSSDSDKSILWENDDDSWHFNQGIVVGSNGSGYDVTFHSGTSGDSFVWDASEEKLTITGTNGQTALDIADGNLVVADNIDLEGDIDVNGTANLDVVDIDGAVQIDNTVTVGVNDTGYDVKFFGATATNGYMLWDESTDDLILGSSSQLGIGLTAPEAPLHIVNSSNQLRLATDSSSGHAMFSHRSDDKLNIYSFDGSSYTDILLGVDGSNVGGNVGVGVSNPSDYDGRSSEDLVVGGTSGSHGITIVSGTDSQGQLTFADGASGDEAYRGRIWFDHSAEGLYFTGGGGTGTNFVVDSNSRISLSNNDSGTSNTVFGYQAGNALASGGNYNILVGHLAGTAINTGDDNQVLGAGSLEACTTGSRNVAIGSNVLDLLTTGSDHIFIGYDAGTNVAASQTGTDGSIGIGRDALKALTSGAGNTAVGYQALDAEDTGDRNTAIGYSSLTNVNGADNNSNTGLGYNSGDVITTGTNNTCLGANTDPSANSGANQTMVGSGVTGVADDSVVLGNSAVTAVYMSEDAGALVHAAGIQFPASQVANGGANVLDDYEEGVHAVTIGGATVGMHSGKNSLQYTKIGRLVTLSGEISITSISSNTGTFTVSLPFTVGDTDDLAERFQGTFSVQNCNFSGDYINIGSYGAQDTMSCQITNDNGAWTYLNTSTMGATTEFVISVQYIT